MDPKFNAFLTQEKWAVNEGGREEKVLSVKFSALLLAPES
jgi:hypothetical protein